MKRIEDYYKACNVLAQKFAEDVFEIEYDITDMWTDEPGSIILINDFFIDMGNITDYYKYGYTPDEFIDWYYYALDELTVSRSPINMKNFIKKK